MGWFHDYTFTWWEIGLLKLSMLAAGIAIGAGWPQAFAGWTTALWIVFAASGLYLVRASLKQM